MSSRKDSVRLKAEAYYIENIDATNKEIAELFKVTEKTIGSWVTKYDWENKRWNFNASPTFILHCTLYPKKWYFLPFCWC